MRKEFLARDNIVTRFIDWFASNDGDLWLIAGLMALLAFAIQCLAIKITVLLSNDSSPNINMALALWSMGWIVLFRYYLKKERDSYD